MKQSPPKDFFISYTSSDRQWAEWIAWHLEKAGFSVVIQAWDFRPGSNFILEMDQASQQASRTVAVLSSNYLQSHFTNAEWAAVFRRDPIGFQGLLLPVRIQKCNIEGLLGPLVYIDLVDLDEITALEKLLAGIARARAKPSTEPSFPGKVQPTQHEPPHFPGALPPIWNVPSQRNPFFTGREEVLMQLHNTLGAEKMAALSQPQAITGLGGIGKTQTAIEYAYRFSNEYEAVLWTNAETRETLLIDYATIAGLLNLPEKDEQEQSRVIEAVKRWLIQNTGWLIILDNVDDLLMIREFLPQSSKGHLLLTTRAHSMGGIAQIVEIEKMGSDEGSLFLLRRAKLVAATALFDNATERDRKIARELVQLVDGLPLALDQAGAYIEETACGLQSYLELYRTQRVQLLKERGRLVLDHPEPVATTWSLSFEKVEIANPTAADLLVCCAFLAPDAIPEELFTKSAADLSPILKSIATEPSSLNAAIRELFKYSLIQREPENRTLSMHRLVQDVLKDYLQEETQRQWAERVVRAISHVFPSPEYANWDLCRRYLFHAQACITLIEQWNLLIIEAGTLLNQVGYYLWQRGEYGQVELLHQRALSIREQVLGSEHPSTATSLTHLAFLYNRQGKYELAEPLYQRALAIYEKKLGPEHPNTANCLDNLAELYRNQRKYEQAEPLYQRALAIRERVLGSEHTNTAVSLNNLATLYDRQGKYELSEPLYQRAHAINVRTLGVEHPSTAQSLNNLAALYYNQGNYELAEPLSQRALAIRERVLGPEHPDTAISLDNLATLYNRQVKYELAEPLYQRALAIRERVLGPEHPDTATSLNNLAANYFNQKNYELAAPLSQRALAIRERVLGPEHPKTAISLNNLAAIYHNQDKYELAEPLYQRALAIREHALGPEHPDTATSLNNLAAIYRTQDKYEQLATLYNRQGKYELAEPLYQRALAIRERVLGPEHPDTATSLNNLAANYFNQKNYELATPLSQRALAIRERVLGPEHPKTATSLSNLAAIYHNQGMYELAEPLYQRALAIREPVLGPEHPDTATSLNNLALLYYNQGRYELAEPLYQRALAIQERVLGPEHLNTAQSLNNLAAIYHNQGRYELAEPLYQRALAIYERILGSEHSNTTIVVRNNTKLLQQIKHTALTADKQD